MPRRIFKHFSHWVHANRQRWYLRMFGEQLADRHLWSLNRHSITAAFGAGVAIAFIPLPVHTVLAVIVAIAWRLNLPAAIIGTFAINPLTLVPVYYGAYRFGAWLLREPPRQFQFELSWRWLERGLGPVWEPFLVGCLIGGIAAGLLSRLLLEQSWRFVVMKKYRLRQRQRTNL